VTNNIANYRLISLLTSSSKISEKAIYKKLLEHITTKNLPVNEQFVSNFTHFITKHGSCIDGKIGYDNKLISNTSTLTFLWLIIDDTFTSESYILSLIFIPGIGTGLQNPHGYGNSHICLKNLAVKSI
jgi:hypothetical protein